MRFSTRDKRNHPEFLPDSAEQIARSIDMNGLRGKLDQAFEAAIARASGRLQGSRQAAINETREVGSTDDAPLR